MRLLLDECIDERPARFAALSGLRTGRTAFAICCHWFPQ